MRNHPLNIVREDAVDFLHTAQLLDEAFPDGYPRDEHYLAWAYRQTDDVPAVVVAAKAATQKVGQMVFLPHRFAHGPRDLLLGQTIDFFLSPGHRNGPAVIRLSRSALEAFGAQGLDGIYGAPNSASLAVTKRFLKADHELTLTASIGLIWPHTKRRVRKSTFVADCEDEHLEAWIAPYLARPHTGRIWTPAALVARLRSPVTRFAVHGTDGTLAVSCARVIRGVRLTTLCAFFSKNNQPISRSTMTDLVAAACDLHACAKYCYVGVNETLHHAPGFVVPERLRPSPLRFVARLSAPDELPFRPSRFELIDFDIV